MTETAPAGELPEGEFARVEITGYQQRTGWVTEGTLAGAPCLVIRDEAGTVLAKVPPGSVHMYVPLLPSPVPRAALTASPAESDGPDGVGPCGCGPYEECGECRSDQGGPF